MFTSPPSQRRDGRRRAPLSHASVALAAVAAPAAIVCLLALTAPSRGAGGETGDRGRGSDAALTFPNPHGAARTVTADGRNRIDRNNPFFTSLGENGRACVDCHQPDSGWTITPPHIRAKFDASQGRDPLFRLVDGANSPRADVSTYKARRKAYTMLLNKGLIRVGLPIPADAEFTLAGVEDPYGFASASELSLFRRPLPSTNLRFISAAMWDGRETVDPMSIQPYGWDESPNVAALLSNLLRQSNNATRGHAEGLRDLTDDERRQIVAFEMGLTTAQVHDAGAGPLDRWGALGGPTGLAAQNFYIGINDNVADPYGPFDGSAMRLYGGWEHDRNPERRAVARGESLFNTRQIALSGVKGLNDNPYFGSPPLVLGTCTTCHNTPNVGNHSISIPLDIGVADAARRTPDMPLYTLRHKVTGEVVQTTDPGRALVTGAWNDVGRFKGPILRGLASRAPYFHNGSAATIEDAVGFYDDRFGMALTRQEKADLVAFLRTL